MTEDLEVQTMRGLIAEAAEWCHHRVRLNDLADCLRTPELAPPRTRTGELLLSTLSVGDLSRRRSTLLGTARLPSAANGTLPSGRLLLFDRETSLSDGAAAAETQFLFDDDNAPPWDTFVCYVRDPPQSRRRWTSFDSYLVCWVPAELVALAARAIDVNPESCLAWADDVARPSLHTFARAMRATV